MLGDTTFLIFAVLVLWLKQVVLTHCFKLLSFFNLLYSEYDDDDDVCIDTVPPHFTEMPRDLEVTANGRIVLECVAQGVPTPTITWRINNTDFHRQYCTPQWRIQNFIMGGQTVEGERSGEGAVLPPQKNLNFYLKMVGFGAF